GLLSKRGGCLLKIRRVSLSDILLVKIHGNSWIYKPAKNGGGGVHLTEYILAADEPRAPQEHALTG
ncbi:MAG: hypothetical protein QNK19_14970, partial [Xanthomonadales bacterium]|nr:hypothetical protein [Xanthomonadales bacterium]